jgi:uncharacterized protein (DUF1778 family)
MNEDVAPPSESVFGTQADRRIFQVDDEQWKAFMAALSRPPKANPGLRKLLARKPAWER